MSAEVDEFFERLQQLRFGAEARLDHLELIQGLPQIPDEILHELRVHQVELEMQNEKLRRAQLALETSRAHYVELYDFAPVGYLTLTADGIIVEINLTGAKLLGKERQKLIKQRFVKFVRDEYQEQWYRFCLCAKQQDEKQTCALSLHRGDQKEGKAFCAQVDYQYRQIADAPPFLYITLTDITERINAEALLKQNESLFRTMIEQAPTGMFVLSAELRLQQINALALPVFETIQPLNDRDFSEVFCHLWGEEVAGQIVDIFRHTLETGEPYHAPAVCLHRQDLGVEQSFEWETQRIILPDGQLGVACYFTDITERKQAEQALCIAAVAFESQDSIMVTDIQGVILRVNQAFSRITGYSSDEAIGKTPHFLRSGRHDEAFYQALWATVADKGYWQGEIWDKRQNGEIFPGWQTITTVRDAAGNVTHHVGYLTDITAQKQAEKVLRDARQRLENQVVSSKEALEQVKQETAEINTALNVLLKHRAADESDTKMALVSEVENSILPFLSRLKKADFGRRQSTRLIDILEINLQQLLNDYGNTANLPAVYQQLTPVEAQVASMVRQGLSTKVIAATLSCASGTVSIHRKHIRKKLGLDNKTCNLTTYLLSLTE
ncbi:MAG: PAS domain S-box protein [Methylococcaceae bacterium]|nr:PAS domain S-box protein [Methylococcaceae bacterium]